MMVYNYNPGTWEAEAGRLQVQSQIELHWETVSKQKKQIPSVFSSFLSIL